LYIHGMAPEYEINKSDSDEQKRSVFREKINRGDTELADVGD